LNNHEVFAAGRLATNNQSIIYHCRGWRNGNMHINHEKINLSKQFLTENNISPY